MSEPKVQCEQCDRMVFESDAKTETYPGPNGNTVTIAFCPECCVL